MPKNLTQAKAGVSAVGDYSGAATGGAAIDILVALLDVDSTSTIRNFLDEMSPAAQVQLLVELAAIKTKINLFEAP